MISDIIYDANQAVSDRIVNMKEVSGGNLGLDPRALYRGWVDDDCIVIKKDSDGSLKYYGGFEYVNEEARVALGDYVIYLRDYDERVNEAIECFQQNEVTD